MITTKTCGTCEHSPNDHHCVGCVWDEDKGENTKWELKENPIVIERNVLDKIRAEIEHIGGDNEKAFCKNLNESYKQGLKDALKVINKYKAESEDKCKNCEYYINPDYTRCHECKAESEVSE